MTSLRIARALRCAMVLVGLAMVGCGGDPIPPDTGPYAVGISGASLDGRLEVMVVDEETGAPIDAPITVLLEDGTLLSARDDAGLRVLEDERLRGAVDVIVAAPGRPQIWRGVAADHVVIGIASDATRAITGTVRGGESLGAEEVRVAASAPVRITRTEGFGRAGSTACASSGGDVCEFTLEAPPATTDLIAILGDATGPALAFGSVGLDASSFVEIEAREPSHASVSIEAALPLVPEGLEAVVGVPGLARVGRVALLAPTSDGMFTVPELTGRLADASWWLIARAQSSVTRAESVVVQRNLQGPDDAGEWPAFLATPELAFEAGTLTIAPVEGASLFVVDWLDASERPVASELVFAGASLSITPPSTSSIAPSAVRVRAIDAPGVDGTALSFDLVERTAMRFSEDTLVL